MEVALETIKNRGPDFQKIEKVDNFYFGAARLAIQNLGSEYNQPMFYKNCVLLYNGELWNQPEDGKYIIDSFLNKKENSFIQLDGMFAFSIYYEGALYLVRDYIGEIPIYYYADNNKFAFASELKAMMALGLKRKDVKLLEPGHYIKFKNSMEIHQYSKLDETPITDPQEVIIPKLRSLLIAAVEKRIPKEVNYSVMLSGGIDSTIITYLLSQINPNVIAYTIHVGDDGRKVKTNDLYFARKAAEWLKIELKEIIIDEEYVLNHIEETVKIIEAYSWTQNASGLCHIAMAKHIKEKVVFGGSGPDEYFAAYSQSKRWNYKTDEDYNRDRKSLIKNINKNNIIRENKCLLSNSIELRSPYLQRELVEYAVNIDPKYRLLNKQTKPLLRMAFSEIPEELLWRGKIPEGEGSDLDRLLHTQKDEIKQIYKRIYG